MIRLAHISDLHFGTENPAVAAALLEDLAAHVPDLVIVSGDLTQRARTGEFVAAARYLDQIKFSKLVIPGNHDIPLFDLFRRFAFPLARYRRHITSDLNPWLTLPGLAILGLNTARSLTWKSGRVSSAQMALISRRFRDLPPDAFRVLVTHHPFIPPPGGSNQGVDLVGRASLALQSIDQCGVDLMLAGHLHHGYSGDIRSHYALAKRSIVAVQAGTAISQRIRNEPNAYNLISFFKRRMAIAVRVWRGDKFDRGTHVVYRLEGEEWRIEQADLADEGVVPQVDHHLLA